MNNTFVKSCLKLSLIITPYINVTSRISTQKTILKNLKSI